jgi:outer membrane protein assembly factor BamB
MTPTTTGINPLKFKFSMVSLAATEFDSLDVYHVAGDVEGEFHATCTTRGMALISLAMHESQGRIEVKQSWCKDMKSRAWQVVANVPSKAGEPAFFTAREDGHFHAYAIDGTPCWSHHFSATISELKQYADPFSGERMLLIPSLDKTLRMLVANTGRFMWGDTFQSGVNVVDQCLLLDGATHVIVAGGNDYTLRCYTRKKNAKAGAYTMAWFHKFDSYVRDVSISPDGRVAAVADDGFVKVLAVNDGKVSWQHEHSSFAWKCKILRDLNRVVSTSYQLPLAVDESGEKLGNPGIITCHDLDSGALLWKTAPDDGINVSAWDFFNLNGNWIIVAGTSAGKVVVINAGSGQVLQAFQAGHMVNRIVSFPLDGGRIAFLGCQESENESLFAGIQEG